MERKTKYAVKGDEIKVKKCPRCFEQLVINMEEDGTEVFTCDKCQFKIKKKK